MNGELPLQIRRSPVTQTRLGKRLCESLQGKVQLIDTLIAPFCTQPHRHCTYGSTSTEMVKFSEAVAPVVHRILADGCWVRPLPFDPCGGQNSMRSIWDNSPFGVHIYALVAHVNSYLHEHRRILQSYQIRWGDDVTLWSDVLCGMYLWFLGDLDVQLTVYPGVGRSNADQQ